MRPGAAGSRAALQAGGAGSRAAEIAVVFGVAGLLIGGLGPLVGDDVLVRQGVAWLASILMVVTIGVALWLRGQGWDHLGLGRIPGWRGVAGLGVRGVGVAVLAVAAFLVGAVVMANLGPTPEAADTSEYGWLQGNLPGLLGALAAIYIGSSFAEEVIYRGFLMTRLAELAGGGRRAWAGALLASAVVFGLAHYTWGPAGMVQTGFMGLALGAAYLHYRDLWVTVAAHALLDTVLMVQQYLG